MIGAGRKAILGLTVAAAMAMAQSASAVFIPNLMPGNFVGTPSGGLGEMFLSPPGGPGFVIMDGIDTNAEFNNLVVPNITGAPDGTWTITNIDYPSGPTTSVEGSVNVFLGVESATLTGGIGSQSTFNAAQRFSGFFIVNESMDMIEGNATIDVNWANYGDDGTVVQFNNTFIPGVDTQVLAPNRAFPGAGAGDEFVTEFEGAGLYFFDYVGWNGFGGHGYLLGSSIPTDTGADWNHLDGGGLNPHEDLGIFKIFGSQLGALEDFQLDDNGGGGGGVIPAPAALPAGLVLLAAMGLTRGRRRRA